MNNLTKLLLGSLLSIGISQQTVAQEESNANQPTRKQNLKKNKNKKQLMTKKAHTTLASAKGKTVGQVLKQANDHSIMNLARKKQTALPAFSTSILPGNKEKSVVDLSQVKPPRTSSFMEDAVDDKAKLEKITDQQIQELFKLTEKFKNSPQRGDLWLRLAELYVEKAGIIDYRKQTDYDQKLRDFQDGRTKVKPRLNLTDAREYNKKAIQLYAWFIRDYPKDEKMDQALFFLGYNTFELGQVKRGMEYYQKLTKEHSNSLFITESHFALAEYYFENEKWKFALEHYGEVTKKHRSRLYGFSTYKSAWCHYRLGDTDGALKTMERLIQENRQAEQAARNDGRKVSKARLEKEGLRDIVLFYSDYTNAKNAVEYFNRIAGNDSPSYIEKLAYLYVDKGHRDAAKTLFSHMILKDPTNSKAFDYKYQIIQAFSNASKTREFREEFFSWIHDYGPTGVWYQANKGNKELIEKTSKLRETTLKNWILTQHQTAQNSHARLSMNQAFEGYKLYLQEFTDSAATADMHFFYAELLYDMEKYDEAEVQYRWVVENAPNSKYGAKAGENIVIALQREVPKDEEISAYVGKSLDPVEFSTKVKGFIEGAEWYMKKAPQSDKTAELKFRIGRLHYQHNQFDKAIELFKEVVEKYPKTKYADYSANLLLDIFNLKKDFAGMEKTARDLLAVPAIAASAAGSDIRNVVERAQFKKAQDLEIEKNYSESAEQFEQYAHKNISGNLAPAAFFNAALNYERAGVNSKAMANHSQVLSLKQKEAESLKPKSRRILAKLYQDAGMLEESAKTYQASAHESAHDPLTPNLFYNSAILFEAMGRNTEAVQNYQSYYQTSKKADRADVIFQIAEIHRRAGQKKESAENYKQYFKLGHQNEKSVEAAYWVADFYKHEQKNHEYLTWKHKTMTLQKALAPGKKGPGAQWAAKFAYEDVQRTFEDFKNIKIPADPRQQQKVVQKKLANLTELNKELVEVIKFDSPEEIVNSLILSGQSYSHMAESLLSAPVPKDLKPDEVTQYKEGLKKITDPFAAKAKESFKSAVDRAIELEVYGKELARARSFYEKYGESHSMDRNEVSLDSRMESWNLQ